MNPIDEMIRDIASQRERRPLEDAVSVHIDSFNECHGLDVKMSGSTTGLITALAALVIGLKQSEIPAAVIRIAVEAALSNN